MTSKRGHTSVLQMTLRMNRVYMYTIFLQLSSESGDVPCGCIYHSQTALTSLCCCMTGSEEPLPELLHQFAAFSHRETAESCISMLQF